MLANREGIFLATIGDHSVAPNGPNKLATLIANFRLIEEVTSEGATDISNEDMSITGYFHLENRDGSINEFKIKMLRDATGWDGRDPFWLEDSLPSDLVVKLDLRFEVYNGRQLLKIAFINHRDATGGGVVKATDAEKAAIRAKLGSKLRAISGGSPMKSNAPAGTPTMPIKTSTPQVQAETQPAESPATSAAAAPAPVPHKRGRPKSAVAPSVAPVIPARPPECTQDQAWDAFAKAAPMGATEENVSSEWTRILNDMFPSKGDEDMSPADWARVRDEAPSKILPF